MNGLSVDIHKSDATTLPFADATFDCVYSFGVIHHIPEAEQVIADVRRVLEPGGTLMLALYYKWSAFHLFSKIFAHGLLMGWLFTKGYAGTLATIEAGADGVGTKPYVKMYSKKDMAHLVSGFRVQDISIHQLKADHFSRVFRWMIPDWFVRRMSRLGWYVACKAER